MAEPGSWFPQQFAQTILQLNAQRQQQQAQLEEMRSQRAASNFLDKERLELQRQGMMIDDARQGRAQLGQEEAQKARIQLETEKIKLERDGLTAKAFDDFSRYGSAFLPNTAAGDISKFRDAYNRALGSTDAGPGYTVHEFEIPGAGVYLQRIGGPGLEQNALELEKTRQEIENLKQTRALQHAGQQLSEERAETERTKRLNLVGGVTARDAEFARSGLETYRKNSSNALREALANGDTKRAAALSLDWKHAFVKPEDRKRVDNFEAIIDAFNESRLSGHVPTQTNLDALRKAGVADDYFEAAGQALFTGPGERIVGRIVQEPHARQPGQAVGESFLLTESGRRIPVSPTEARATPLGSIYREPSAASPGPAAAEPAPDPAADVEAVTRAKQLIDDVQAGKRPPGPEFDQAKSIIRSYIERMRAAQ